MPQPGSHGHARRAVLESVGGNGMAHRVATRDERRAANGKVLWLITATSFWVGVI